MRGPLRGHPERAWSGTSALSCESQELFWTHAAGRTPRGSLKPHWRDYIYVIDLGTPQDPQEELEHLSVEKDVDGCMGD